MRTFILPIALAGALCLLPSPPLRAIVRSWDGGGGDNLWSNTLNWSPNGDPGDDDLTIAGVLIGAGPHTVLDTDFVIASLTLQNSSEIDTNNFLLAVEGHASIEGSGTRLKLYERQSPGDNDSLDADTLNIGGGAFVEMYESSVLEVDSGPLSLFGTLVGNGTVELVDNPASPTALMSISGTLSAGQAGSFLGAPLPRTMTITATDADARVGMTNVGVIEVQNNATLINQVRMLNDHLINLRLYPNSTYQAEHSWHLTGNIEIATNAFSGTEPASIVGGQAPSVLVLDTGSTITIDTTESLRFGVQVSSMGAGVIDNRGTLIFDAPAQFGNVAGLQMNGGAARMIVNSNVLIQQNSFDIDAAGSELGEVTVNEGAQLSVDVADFGGGDAKADGTINVNSGEFILTRGTAFALDGTLRLNNTNGSPAVMSGSSTLVVGDGAGSSDANLTVGGSGVSELNYPIVVFFGDADVDVAAGATLDVNANVTYQGQTATFDGAGTLKPGRMSVLTPTTFNVAVVYLDDDVSPGGPSHSIGASLTIQANSIDDGGDGFDGEMLISNNLGTLTGELDVLVPGGQTASWRFDSGEIRLIGPDPLVAPNAAEMLDGSAIQVGVEGGVLAVDGWARSQARLDIFGTVSIVNAGDDIFVLSGGSEQNPNRLLGGSIDGAGLLQIQDSQLRGFGAINTGLDGTDSSSLVAEGGVLLVNGAFQNFDSVEVANGALLDAASGWSAESVTLFGGELAGATVFNNAGRQIRGHGLITAQVANNGVIRAEGGTLTLDPATNNNDYDGASGTGTLIADSGDLVLRKVPGVGLLIGIGGTMQANPGRMIEVDDRFELFPAGDLQLDDATFRSTNASTLSGTISTLGTQPSRIVLDNMDATEIDRFAGTASLGANLELDTSNSVIEAEAVFSGTGSLVNLAGSRVQLSDGLGLAVPFINHGLTQIGNETLGDNQLGTVELDALTQSSTGELQIELSGLGAGQFDSLLVNNNAILEGLLTIDLLGTFTPLLGNSWTILTTSLGLVDADQLVLDAPVVNNLTFELIANSNSLVLQVVPAGLPGDFNHDDVVDGYDFLAWQRGESPDPLSPFDLADWQTNYGASASQTAATSAVPEPAAWALMSLAAWGLCRACPRRR